jgi:hypothetical protein
MCCTLTREDSHLPVVIRTNGVVTGREGIDAIEMIAFDPILQFAGLIACVLPDLEHRDDDNLDLDAMRRREQRYRAMECEGQNAERTSELRRAKHSCMICNRSLGELDLWT